MKVLTLTMSKLSYQGDGCYGTYYKIKGKKIGVKILNSESSHPSYTSLIKSEEWLSTRDEYKQLVKARKIADRNVPRPVGMAVVKRFCSYQRKHYYDCGYVMEHVQGELVDWVDDVNFDRLELIKEKLRKKGLKLMDDHGENTIVGPRNRFVFIDAARFHIREKGKRRRKRRKKNRGSSTCPF